MKTKIFKGTKQLADYLIKEWLCSGRKAVARRKYFFAAIAGGRTPRDIYRRLAKCGKIDFWGKTHLFLSDERFVSFTNPGSNYKMIKGALLDLVDIPSENVHVVSTGGSAPPAASDYEKKIERAFGLKHNQWPRFDLMILGIGGDGHIASLFPGDPALKETKHLAAFVRHKNLKHERVTLTLPVINCARRVIFLVRGKRKAKIIRSILREKMKVPAALVKVKHNRVVYVLDKEAAKFL
jgi:6-phosphogluconolactonase